MHRAAAFAPIRQLVEGCWPGEWGVDPIADQANCVVYRATDIDDEGHLNGNGGAARFVFPAKVTSKALRENDILLEASGGAPDRPVGRVALVQGLPPCPPALTSNFFRFIRPKQGVDARYLAFQLVALNRSSAIWRYQQQTTGLINLKVADYLGHPIWAPALAVQQKIAAILTSIDTAIEKTEALIEKYQQIKAGLMHDLFTRGALPNGQLRPPLEQAPDLYQQTAIGWIPKEWEVSGLAPKARKGTSFLRTGPFGSSLKGEHWVQHGHPVITIGALGEGDFLEEGLLFVGRRDATRLKDFQLTAGDVVFSRVADVGRSVVVRQEQAGWIMSSNLMRIAVDESSALPDFVQMQLAFDARVKRQIRAKVTGGGREVANSEVLSQLRFAWPEITEQGRIVAIADRVNERLKSERSIKANLEAEKLGLMQDLLTGKVPVKVGAGETAYG